MLTVKAVQKSPKSHTVSGEELTRLPAGTTFRSSSLTSSPKETIFLLVGADVFGGSKRLVNLLNPSQTWSTPFPSTVTLEEVEVVMEVTE